MRLVFWEDGLLRHRGRVDMTRPALEGLGKTLSATDQVVIEATGNCMAVSRVLSQFVQRVEIANPLQVKAIAHAHVTALAPGDGTWTAHCTHAVGICFAPKTRGEFDILERIRCDTDYVSVAGQAIRGLPALSIIDSALNGSDAVAAKAVDNFATYSSSAAISRF